MPFDDPKAWSEGAAAFKAIFDGLRSAIGMVRDLRGGGSASTPKEDELIEAALDKASKATAIAEAEVAKALGYELCKCKFPPTPMLTVGWFEEYGKGVRTVFQCSACGFNTAGPYNWTRTPEAKSP